MRWPGLRRRRENVLGDFDNASFTHAGVTTRFLRNGATYQIETQDGTGATRVFDVVGVAGIDPLQQYLLSPEPGRSQAFDIAWDVAGQRWYPVFPDPQAGPGNGFHWTGPYKSWEARCAECHATGYTRNYDPQTRLYAPVLTETGVGCEACHGPGAAHLAWAADPAAPLGPGLGSTGLTADLGASQQNEIQQCLTCHSRREALADGNPLPGTNYHDAFNLSLLREGVYGPDGSIQDEVYEGGSFQQSLMHEKGVRCSDCHDPHSGQLRAEGNEVCAQCHSAAGNPRFPTLQRKVYDSPEHHFHAEGGPGSQCIACHSIARTYMGVDLRHDHYFRIPRPDLASTGAPDACTDCHTDKDAAWAAADLQARFPDSPHRVPGYAGIIASARLDPQSQIEPLIALAEWDGPAVVRASALDLLAPLADPSTTDRVTVLLADPDPLVRAAAANALRALPPQVRLNLLWPLLTDPVRNVRVAAARALLDVQTDLSAPAARPLAAAMDEWRGALLSRTDFPETHLQIGGGALTMRNWPLAVQAFREAVDLDPQLDSAWSMIVQILAATGDTDGAIQALKAGLAAAPDSAELFQLQLQMGLPIVP